MPEEIYRSQDFTLNYPIASDVNLPESKTVEKKVTLPGMDHPITVKIHTSLNVSNDQVDEAHFQSREALKGLVEKSSTGLELKLSLTTPDTQEAARISTLFAKTATGEIENRIKEASRDQKYTLTESKIKAIAQEIMAHGDLALQRAKESGQKVLVNTDHPDIQLVATKSGKLYVKVSVLGTGFFKETALFANVVDVNRETQAKHAAVGIPKGISLPAESPERKRLEREYQNEVQLHQDLITSRKDAIKNGHPDPLSHVAISKIISGNIPSVALMGIPLNGGNVDTRIKEKSLRPEEKALICADFLSGAAELHAAGVIHRDIKADNILLQTEERLLPQDQWPSGLTASTVPPGYSIEWENDQIKSVRQTVITKAVLCDLGKGSQLDPAKRFFNSTLYSEVMPPGRFTKADVHYSPKLDVYSAGRTAYQIFAGIPVSELRGITRSSIEREAITNQMKVVQKEIRETKDETTLARLNEQLRSFDQQLIDWDERNLGPPANWTGWNNIPPKVQDYIKRMVDADPAKRPTAAEAASFFRSLTPEDLVTPAQPTQAIANEPSGYSGYQSESSEGYRPIGYSSDDAS